MSNKRGGGKFSMGGGQQRKNWRANNNSNPHFEHDNRDHNGRDGHVRRVSFKTGGKKHYNNKFNKLNLANLSLEDDIDMGTNSGLHVQVRGRGGKPTMGRFRGQPGYYNGPVFEPGPCPWYQVTIPFGGKHEKDFLLKALLSHLSPDVFIPYYYKTVGEAAMFYVDDVRIAEKLFYTNRKISMPDGFKMIIKLRNMMPKIDFTDEQKGIVKLVMAKRYNPATKALDLTKFHADTDLVDLFVPLFRPAIMQAVIEIIHENIPDLEALNLNDNKLHMIDHMKMMPIKLKNLKILYLGDNKIPNVMMLDALKGLSLVELLLKGNPLTRKCRNQDAYVSEVRKRFPKLQKLVSFVELDGEVLPPMIGFDGDDDALHIPQKQQSFLVNPQGQELIREFLTQYFAIYDSDSRQSLLEAYHDKAMFSMNACNYDDDERNSASKRLGVYFNNSRNFLRLLDRNVRRRALKVGKLQVVSLIEDLPKTQHDLQGFCVDLLVFTPTIITVSLNGVYRERASNLDPKPVRAFHRTLIIVPNNGGFCIQNDMLFVTNCTIEQERTAFAVQVTTPPPTPAPTPVAGNDLEKQQLVMTLAQHTGMNLHWSTNCLQETAWDYQRAIFIFTQLKEQGKIPPEAFVK